MLENKVEICRLLLPPWELAGINTSSMESINMLQSISTLLSVIKILLCLTNYLISLMALSSNNLQPLLCHIRIYSWSCCPWVPTYGTLNLNHVTRATRTCVHYTRMLRTISNTLQSQNRGLFRLPPFQNGDNKVQPKIKDMNVWMQADIYKLRLFTGPVSPRTTLHNRKMCQT